jgi:hypothetical protein
MSLDETALAKNRRRPAAIDRVHNVNGTLVRTFGAPDKGIENFTLSTLPMG